VQVTFHPATQAQFWRGCQYVPVDHDILSLPMRGSFADPFPT
jgi:hypothetical protein